MKEEIENHDKKNNNTKDYPNIFDDDFNDNTNNININMDDNNNDNEKNHKEGYNDKYNNEKDNKSENNDEDIITQQKFEEDQEILNNGIEVTKDSPSNSIKIMKKDKHGDVLSNINYDYIFKVALIGDSATGKTSILLRFIDDYFTEDTKSTIGVDFKIVSLLLEPKVHAKMQIWDTCGSERFKSLTSSFIKTCSAFILVFDLTRTSTFQNIEHWIRTIKENTSPKFLILIGNKSDLVEQRALNKDFILEYCQKHFFNYLEISAKNNSNIEIMFKEVAYQLYMDIKKKENANLKSKGKKGNFTNISNIQVQLESEDQKKNGCCS
jgi:small GTP-binding protein